MANAMALLGRLGQHSCQVPVGNGYKIRLEGLPGATMAPAELAQWAKGQAAEELTAKGKLLVAGKGKIAHSITLSPANASQVIFAAYSGNVGEQIDLLAAYAERLKGKG